MDRDCRSKRRVDKLCDISRGVDEPMIRHLPKIIEFLGYDPLPEPTALPARIAYARRRLGLTQEELATALKVDGVTILRWEKGLSSPTAGRTKTLQNILGSRLRIVPASP